MLQRPLEEKPAHSLIFFAFITPPIQHLLKWLILKNTHRDFAINETSHILPSAFFKTITQITKGLILRVVHFLAVASTFKMFILCNVARGPPAIRNF